MTSILIPWTDSEAGHGRLDLFLRLLFLLSSPFVVQLAPLADADIQSYLQNEGVDIARRTVAKYRKCMRIPSSFARRNRKILAKGGSQIASKHQLSP